MTTFQFDVLFKIEWELNVLWYSKIKYNRAVLTLDDNWLDKLITCSRASHNSRFRRRTSFAWRSSVEPYNDEPPDINDAALPCTKQIKNKLNIQRQIKIHVFSLKQDNKSISGCGCGLWMHTIVIFLWIC